MAVLQGRNVLARPNHLGLLMADDDHVFHFRIIASHLLTMQGAIAHKEDCGICHRQVYNCLCPIVHTWFFIVQTIQDTEINI